MSNTGYRNTGDWNTGDWNTGSWNTGNWNTCSYETGAFNTIQVDKIRFFLLENAAEKNGIMQKSQISYISILLNG